MSATKESRKNEHPYRQTTGTVFMFDNHYDTIPQDSSQCSLLIDKCEEFLILFFLYTTQY